MDLDIDQESPSWAAVDFEGLVDRAIGATLDHLGIPRDPVNVSVLACDDTRIAALNADFRDKPTPTNVLSWPAEDVIPPAVPRADPDGTLSLGDIAISFDTCAREAVAASKPMSAHVTHLIIHGTLHLLGYDHINDAQAVVMERIETEILGKLGLPDPYSV